MAGLVAAVVALLLLPHPVAADERQDELDRTRRQLGEVEGRDYATTDCGRQLGAFRAYPRDRYGTAERAKAFWQTNGCY